MIRAEPIAANDCGCLQRRQTNVTACPNRRARYLFVICKQGFFMNSIGTDFSIPVHPCTPPQQDPHPQTEISVIDCLPATTAKKFRACHIFGPTLDNITFCFWHMTRNDNDAQRANHVPLHQQRCTKKELTQSTWPSIYNMLRNHRNTPPEWPPATSLTMLCRLACLKGDAMP